jgi:hypothetical protein
MGDGGYADVLWPVIRGCARGRREVPTVSYRKCPVDLSRVADLDVELDLSRLPTTKKAPLVAGPDVNPDARDWPCAASTRMNRLQSATLAVTLNLLTPR